MNAPPENRRDTEKNKLDGNNTRTTRKILNTAMGQILMLMFFYKNSFGIK